ncbi:MAG: plasmid stabilization protein [Acidobacteriota bacterium]
MASITIRRLDEKTKERLRAQASRHGRSMEEEAREILKEGVSAKTDTLNDLGESIHRRFAALGGLELDIRPRKPMREPPDFSR